MTIKKAAKNKFLCEGVHTGKNLWIGIMYFCTYNPISAGIIISYQTVEIFLGILVWWMTIKKAAKNNFFVRVCTPAKTYELVSCIFADLSSLTHWEVGELKVASIYIPEGV